MGIFGNEIAIAAANKLFSMGVCHESNLWVVIFVPYFFTL
jgi:hypothetical protein